MTDLCPVDLQEIQTVLLEAGRIVQHGYHAPRAASYKQDGSPLTRTDQEVDAFLKTRLRAALPAAGWLSEETADDPQRLEREWVWIVDPLDGTKEFVQRIPELAVSIGLVHAGQVVLGGVYNPLTGEGGTGVVGGACLFWGLETAPPGQQLEEITALVSRTEIEAGNLQPYAGIFRQLKPVGSVAYKLLRVAAGADLLTFSVQPKSEWDLCGGVGLLQAAGKTYLRLDGQPLRFNQPNTRILSGGVATQAALAPEVRRRLLSAPPFQFLAGRNA